MAVSTRLLAPRAPAVAATMLPPLPPPNCTPLTEHPLPPPHLGAHHEADAVDVGPRRALAPRDVPLHVLVGGVQDRLAKADVGRDKALESLELVGSEVVAIDGVSAIVLYSTLRPMDSMDVNAGVMVTSPVYFCLKTPDTDCPKNVGRRPSRASRRARCRMSCSKKLRMDQ